MPRDAHSLPSLPLVLGVFLALVALYQLGAALLLAVNPFHVYFSQHARFYALFMLLSVLQMISLLRAAEQPS